MSSFCKCKSYSHFAAKILSVYAIFNDQSFKDLLTNDIVSFEQLGPELKKTIGGTMEGPNEDTTSGINLLMKGVGRHLHRDLTRHQLKRKS